MKNIYPLLLVVAFLFASYCINAQNLWTQQGLAFTGTNVKIASSTGTLSALSADGQTAVSFYSREDKGSGFFVYRLNGVNWVKQTQIHIPSCAPGTGISGPQIRGGIAISADGNTIALTGSYSNLHYDTIWIYSFQNNSWNLQSRLVSRNSCYVAYQNTALSYDGNTLIYNAQVWVRSNNTWSLQTTLIPTDRPLATSACFDTVNRFSGATSCAISADGNSVVVGDLSAPDSSTCAWVFTRYGTNWQQQGPRLNGMGSWGFPFTSTSSSSAVAMSGDGNSIAVTSNGSRKVWLFMREGAIWSRVLTPLQFPSLTYSSANLVALSYNGTRVVVSDGSSFSSAWNANGIWKIAGTSTPCLFESAMDSVAYKAVGRQSWMGVDSSGKKVFFGVPTFRYSQGGCWYFNLTSDSVWQPASGRLYEDGSFNGSRDQYHTMAMSGDGSTIVVGRSDDDGTVGAAWVFKLQGNQWVQVGPKMLPPTGGVWKPYAFGSGVAITADASLLFIGATAANLRLSANYGNVYVYQYNGSTYVPLLDSLIPAQNQQGFGRSVAVSDDGNTLMAVNSQSGVHFMVRSGNNWVQQDYFNNSIGTGAIALSGDGNTAVIGDQLYGGYDGSITIFRRNGSTWTQQATNMQTAFNTVYFPNSLSLSYNGDILYAGERSLNKTFYTKRNGSTWSPLDTVFNGGTFFGGGTFVYSSQTGDTLFDFGGWSSSNENFKFFKRVSNDWQYYCGFTPSIKDVYFSGDHRVFGMNGDLNEFAISIRHTADNFMYPQASTIYVLSPMGLADSTLQVKNASCVTTANGKIRVGILAGSPPYHFNWSNNAPDADSAVNLLPGIYNLTISDAAGDTLFRKYVIQATQVPSTRKCSSSFNCNAGIGTATLTPTGGTAPYTFLWNTTPTQSTLTAVNLLPGTYSYKVTDSAGCYYTDSVYIDPLSTWVSVNSTALNCYASGTAIATMYGGEQPFTYNWNTGDTSVQIQVPTLATYTVTVTDVTGCSASASYIAQQECLGFIQGTVFFDRNNNCLQDTGESVAKNYMILATGNSTTSYGVTDTLGHYFMQVPDTGHYTLSTAHWQACPFLVCTGSTYPALVSLTTSINHATTDFAIEGQELDLTVLTETPQPFPGSTFNYRIYYGNRMDSVLSSATITLAYDSVFLLNSTNPPYITHDTATHTITWNVANVGNIYSYLQYVSANFITPTMEHLPVMPYSALMEASISIPPDDCLPTNNNNNHSFLVLGAHDPNYKVAFPENVLSASDSIITYTIHFQNVGSGPTHFIEIVDTLDESLDPSSVQMVGAFHHPYVFTIKGGNILSWTFDPYALPDSSSDPIGSQGYVSFAVSLKPGLPTGTIIPNTGHIYFDYNDVVVTNTVVNNVDLCFGLTSNPTYRSAQICNGDAFDFYGQQLFMQGNYQKSFSNSKGCDSVIHLNLLVNPAINTQLNETICTGGSYPFKGQSLTTDGNYYDTLTAQTGCDSIVHLVLQTTQLNTQLNETICTGSNYPFGGHNLTAGGNYYDTLTTQTGCDSIVHLTLQMAAPIISQLNETICTGSNYPFGGQNLTTGGNYYDTLTALTGCDSIVHLALHITPPSNTHINETICNGSSYPFKGQSLTIAGNYTDTLTAVNGCDSLIHLALNIAPVLTGTFSDAVCDGKTYLFNNQQLTNAGMYNDTLQTSGGCDSIVTLILYTTQNQITTINIIIQQDSIYSLPGGTTTSIAGMYYDTLQAANGCDSVVTTNLSVISSAGNMLNSADAFALRPNPANDYLLVTTAISVTEIGVYTITGQEVFILQNPKPVNLAKHDYSVEVGKLAAGTYLIELKGDGTAVRRRWVKM